MNRIGKLQTAMLHVIKDAAEPSISRDETLEWECIHMASCARTAYLMAQQAGMDPEQTELCACAAAVHDFGRIITGKQPGHAEAGYEPVKVFLRETGLFAEAEIEQIALAAKNHSRKSEIGTPIEEIVKDADLVDCFQFGAPFQRPEQEDRYRRYIERTVGA